MAESNKLYGFRLKVINTFSKQSLPIYPSNYSQLDPQTIGKQFNLSKSSTQMSQMSHSTHTITHG